jgi:hypothetical protein
VSAHVPEAPPISAARLATSRGCVTCAGSCFVFIALSLMQFTVRDADQSRVESEPRLGVRNAVEK